MAEKCFLGVNPLGILILLTFSFDVLSEDIRNRLTIAVRLKSLKNKKLGLLNKIIQARYPRRMPPALFTLQSYQNFNLRKNILPITL